VARQRELAPTAEEAINLVARLDESELRRLAELVLQAPRGADFVLRIIIQLLPEGERHRLWRLLRDDDETVPTPIRTLASDFFAVQEELATWRALDEASAFKLDNGLRLQKKKRDPKPRNRARNQEIIRLRDSDPKKWSWARLGKKYGMSKDAARQAYKAEKKRQEEEK
jgi:Mitochondrial ribosomal protein subunit L20